jgi:hypothetical protein
MIVHEYKLIFIHINRTGGVSVETAFEQPTMDHRLPGELIRELGKDVWDTYYKFAFVRNPWDRMVSVYSNRKRWNSPDSTKNIGFEEWLLGLNYFSEFNQLHWICKKSRMLVDFVGRFERLEKDFKTVCHKIGVEKQLPHLNSSQHKPYQCYYTEKTKRLIEIYCQKEIKMFGYRFDRPFL